MRMAEPEDTDGEASFISKLNMNKLVEEFKAPKKSCIAPLKQKKISSNIWWLSLWSQSKVSCTLTSRPPK